MFGCSSWPCNMQYWYHKVLVNDVLGGARLEEQGATFKTMTAAVFPRPRFSVHPNAPTMKGAVFTVLPPQHCGCCRARLGEFSDQRCEPLFSKSLHAMGVFIDGSI